MVIEMRKRFDYEESYLTFDGEIFAIAENKKNAMVIGETLIQLFDENEQLTHAIDNMGGRLQGLWANYYENRWGVWSEAVEDVAKELGFKIYKPCDAPISNSDSKKERINGVKKLNEIICENKLLKQENKELTDLLTSMADRNNEIRLDNGWKITLKKVFKEGLE